jgi:GntR family transcriptional regulator
MSRELPIHRQIAEQLRQRIVAGCYEKVGLPPELTLKDEFGVSRHTIRSALQALVQDGLIERRARLGTHLTQRARGGVWAVNSLENMIGEFSIDQCLTLRTELVPAGRFPSVAALFKTRLTGQLFHVLRIFPASGSCFAILNAFTSAHIGRQLPAGEIVVKPVVEVVERRCGLRAARARQLATAAAADAATASQLETPPGAPILVLHRTYFTSDDEPLAHAETLCRPDKYQQVVDFVRETRDEVGIRRFPLNGG